MVHLVSGVQSFRISREILISFLPFCYFTYFVISLYLLVTLFIISLDSRRLKEGDNDNDRGKGTGRSGRDSPEDLRVMA